MWLKPPGKLAKIVNSHSPYTPFEDMQIQKYVKNKTNLDGISIWKKLEESGIINNGSLKV